MIRYDYDTLTPLTYQLPDSCTLASVHPRTLEEIYVHTKCGLKLIRWTEGQANISYFPDDRTGNYDFKQVVLSPKGTTEILAVHSAKDGFLNLFDLNRPDREPQSIYLRTAFKNQTIAQDATFSFDPVHSHYLYFRNNTAITRIDLRKSQGFSGFFSTVFSPHKKPNFIPMADPSTVVLYDLWKGDVELHRFDDSTYSMRPDSKRLGEKFRLVDRHRVILGLDQKTLHWRQVDSGLEKSYESPVEIAYFASISPDELVIAGTDRSLRLWSGVDGRIQDIASLPFDARNIVYYDRSQTLVVSSGLPWSGMKAKEHSILFQRRDTGWTSSQDIFRGVPPEWLESTRPLLLRWEQGSVYIDIFSNDLTLAKSVLMSRNPRETNIADEAGASSDYSMAFRRGNVYEGESVLYYLTADAVRRLDLQSLADAEVYTFLEGHKFTDFLPSRAVCFFTDESRVEKKYFVRPLDGSPMKIASESIRDVPYFPQGAKTLFSGSLMDKHGVTYPLALTQFYRMMPVGSDQMKVIVIDPMGFVDPSVTPAYYLSEYRIDAEWFDRLLERWPLYEGEAER
jgi:hypothetical protein